MQKQTKKQKKNRGFVKKKLKVPLYSRKLITKNYFSGKTIPTQPYRPLTDTTEVLIKQGSV